MSAGSADDADPLPEEQPMAPHVYEMGPNTLRVDRQKLHTGTRQKALNMLKQAVPGEAQGTILLQGGKGFPVYDTDMEFIFRQESFFHYLFGVLEEEGYYGAIDVANGKTTLFMPHLPSNYAVWMGKIHGPENRKERFAVDAVHYIEDMTEVIAKWNPAVIYVLEGVNSDSGHKSTPASFEGLDSYKVNRDVLYNVLAESRVTKTKEELEVLRYVNAVASTAHVELMRKCRPGLMEYALESIFRHSCYLEGGCRRLPYTPICASGPNGAILHYGHAAAPNDRQISNGDIMLLDMGCEYYGYGSDITCSFPADGRFTPEQTLIYEAVLSASTAVLKAMKPGVKWPDMHILAERQILTALKEGGLLKGDVAEMLDFRIGALFMPHGLGHLLGLETHDVGGYLAGTPERKQLPGLRSLRTARVLEAGMVITVEPGCYFNDFLLEPAFKHPAQAKFLNESCIREFLDFGGVRIEDDVIVTNDGAESMTDVPRTVDDIQQVMAGSSWPF